MSDIIETFFLIAALVIVLLFCGIRPGSIGTDAADVVYKAAVYEMDGGIAGHR